VLIAIYLIIQGIIFLWLFISTTRRARFLYWAAFLIPLNSVSLEWLSLWTWAKLVFLIGAIGWVLHAHRWVLRGRGRAPRRADLRVGVFGLGHFRLFLAYSLLLTIGWMFYDYAVGLRFSSAESLGWGVAQSTMRYPVQLFSFFTQWGLVLIGIWFTKAPGDLAAAIRGFVHGNLVNAVTGLYQIGAISLGLPWLRGHWILRTPAFNPSVTAEAGAFLGGMTIPRLSGLGGEPKHAGANFVVALFLLLIISTFQRREHFGIKNVSLVTAVLFLALILTFSLGSWVAFSVAVSYIVLASLFSRRIQIVRSLLVLTVIGVLLLVVVGTDLLSVARDHYVRPRLSEKTVSKYTDSKVLALFGENPLSLVIGRGAGGGDFLLLDSISAGGHPVSSAYTFTRFLPEAGVVGLLMVLLLAVRWSRFLFKTHLLAHGHFILGGFIVAMASHVVFLYGFLLLCGGIVARGNAAGFSHARSAPLLRDEIPRCRVSTKNENRL